jgi:hypothetical protein
LWEIYCLKSNCWRKLDLDMPTQDVCCGGVGVQVYTDGVCHWWYGHQSEIGSEVYLVSFDLNSETFVKTYIPSNMDYIRSASVSAHLGMLNGLQVMDTHVLFTYQFWVKLGSRSHGSNS